MRALTTGEDPCCKAGGEKPGARPAVRVEPFGALGCQPTLTAVLWSFIGLGILLTLANLSWPVARNALSYAKAALGILTLHFNLYAVVHNDYWSAGKPILFSLIAAPFVWLSNANTGTIIASALGTGFFLWTITLALPRLNLRAGLHSRLAPLEFSLAVFNPLVLYQFWSGYPDSLFAGFVLLAFVLIDIISSEPQRDSRWHIVGLGVTICAAIYTKLYGAILEITCPLYLLMHGRDFATRSVHRRSKIALLFMVFSAVALLLISVKLNINPLLVPDSGAGFADYFTGLTGLDIGEVTDSLLLLAFTIVLSFQATLLFLPIPGAWRALTGAPTVFVIIYAIGLLPAPGTSFNMRYFLPALPFLATLIASGAWSTPRTVRRSVLVSFWTIAMVLTLNFNVGWVQETLRPISSKLYAWQPKLPILLDNLRLSVQMALKKQIDTINTAVPVGSILYWSSDYYGASSHGLAHHLGVRNDLDVRYVLEPTEPAVSSVPVYLAEFTSTSPPNILWRAPNWATSNSLGHGVFRLDPVSITLHSLSGDIIKPEDPMRIQADIKTGTGVKISGVDVSDGSITSHLEPPYVLVVQHPAPGRHAITARATYGEGGKAVSRPLVVYVGDDALERAAESTDDLVTEFHEGSINAPQDSLWLTANDRLAGVRFENIGAPRGAHVAEARLQFTAATPELQPTTLDVYAELSANATGLSFETSSLSRRAHTAARVRWDLRPWIIEGQQDSSPNLASLLREVFAQAGWRPGNSVMLLVHTSGEARAARSFDEDGRGAPTIYIKLEKK